MKDAHGYRIVWVSVKSLGQDYLLEISFTSLYLIWALDPEVQLSSKWPRNAGESEKYRGEK